MKNLNEITGLEIVKRIEELTGISLKVTDDYPAVLTGSTVAVVVLEMLGLAKLKGLLFDSDVDVFCIDSQYEPEMKRSESDVVDAGGYGPFARQLRTYVLESTIRSGPLNVTFIGGHPFYEGNIDRRLDDIEGDLDNLSERLIYRVVKPFDINMVQVGVNLEDYAFYYTEHFKHFTETGQLMAVNIDSCIYTVLRMQKKLEQLQAVSTGKLNFYVDKKRTLTALSIGQSAVIHNLERHKESVEIRLTELDSDRNTYNRCRQEELEELEMTKSNIDFHTRITAYHLQKNGKYIPEWFRINEDRSSSLQRYPMKGFTRDIDDIRNIVVALQMEKNIKHTKNAFLIEGICGSTTFTARAGREIDKFEYFYSLLPSREYKRNTVRKIFHELDGHNLLDDILRFSRTYAEALTICQRVLKFKKKHGTWIIGALETTMNRIPHDQDHVLAFLNSNHAIKTTIDLELDKLVGDIREPIFPADILRRYGNIKEVLTRKELMDEGEEMRHCVGGYGSAVADGTIILSIKEPERCTCEISQGYGNDKKYKMEQVRSYHNANVKEETRELCKRLARILNTLIKKGVTEVKKGDVTDTDMYNPF